MENPISTTEERILEAAKKVFHCKGYDGARMQEIADEAGVNKSLVHYYFRNKDNIYQAVFEDAFSKLIARVNEIFLSDLPFTMKIENFIGHYTSFLSQNSYVPLFIVNAMYQKPEQIKNIIGKCQFSPARLMDQIRRQIKEELNLDIDPFHVYINILALCIFPVIARPLIQNIFGFSNEQLDQYYIERRTVVPEFIINALKGYENTPGK
jgi:TetR/AcrR family transcriptional regulator